MTQKPASAERAGIEVENLVREFRKGPRAVDGIDQTVLPGEICGFLGPNGAGKSTTVLMLTTLLPPTSGRAWVGGYDGARRGAQVRSVIGAALQEAALDAILTGRCRQRYPTPGVRKSWRGSVLGQRQPNELRLHEGEAQGQRSGQVRREAQGRNR